MIHRLHLLPGHRIFGKDCWNSTRVCLGVVKKEHRSSIVQVAEKGEGRAEGEIGGAEEVAMLIRVQMTVAVENP
jgi:hypothetical protein